MAGENSMEKELKSAKRFRAAASVLIVVLLMIICYMNADMKKLANQYEQLEKNYEVIYEDLIGGEE